MINDGTYAGKIMDWGLKHYIEKDEHKVFVKFEFVGALNPGQSETEVTWYGSIDETQKIGKNNKPYSLLGITKGRLKTLGFDKELEELVTTPDPFDREKIYSIQIETNTRDGRTFSYVKDFWEGADVAKPENTKFSRELTPEEAAEVLRKVSGKKTAGTNETATLMPQKKAVNQSLIDQEIPF